MQAAPQVSATAAYLWAMSAAAFSAEYSTPTSVRARIVYTGDLFPSLKNAVIGGRLNMERALDITRTRVVRRDGSEVFGALVAMHSRDRQSLLDTVVFGDMASQTRFALKSLKRMIRDPAGNGYIVFAEVSERGNVIRNDGLPLQTRSAWLEIETDNGPEFIEFRDIQDYTAKY